MIYVSHFLEELLDISDNLVILRNGKRVPVHFTSSGNRLKDVVAAMLGETPESIAEQSQNSKDEIDVSGSMAPIEVGSLRIVGLKGPAGLVIDKLEIHPGTIVGVAGLAGAGVEELFAVLFGLTKPTSGSITLPTGAPLPHKAAKAVKAGIAYSPADRKQYGLMLRQSIAENIVSVRALTLGHDGFVLRGERLRKSATERCRQLGIGAELFGSPSAPYRVVTSKKLSLPSGSRQRHRCLYSMTLRAVSMWGPNGKCTKSCGASRNRGGSFSFPQATQERRRQLPTVSSSLSTVC